MWVREMVWGQQEIKSFGYLDEFELHFLSNGVLLDVSKMGVAIDDCGSIRFRNLCRSPCQCLLHLASQMVAPSCKGGWYMWSISWEYCHQEYIPGSFTDKAEVGYWVTAGILGCRGNTIQRNIEENGQINKQTEGKVLSEQLDQVLGICPLLLICSLTT